MQDLDNFFSKTKDVNEIIKEIEFFLYNVSSVII